jgi:hypothetical protein
VKTAPDLEAFMGGVGTSLSVFFILLLLLGGAALVRRLLGL